MEKIFKEVSDQLNLPIEVVRNTYLSYWKYIKSKIESIPIKEDLTEDEFNQYQTRFNLPHLGVLSCNYNYIKKKKEQYVKYKENKT